MGLDFFGSGGGGATFGYVYSNDMHFNKNEKMGKFRYKCVKCIIRVRVIHMLTDFVFAF